MMSDGSGDSLKAGGGPGALVDSGASVPSGTPGDAGRPRALQDLGDLVAAGLVTPGDRAGLEPVSDHFRIRITPEMQQAISPELGPADPVGLQFVPRPEEAEVRPEELYDPIGDQAHSPVAGLTHRYPDRVILHATQTCEVYCRFCFRREAVGASGHLSSREIDGIIDYLARTPAVREVILTGGDPLVLSPRRLGDLLARLSALPHLDVIRFHSRVPVVAPERITEALLATLDIRPAVWIVVHTNHAAELTPAATAALRRLTKAGIPLLSQSVLLRGINDNVRALEDLFRALIRNRVKPYYLHHCDLARGTSHFRTTIAEGQALMEALRGRLTGICQPTYVLDIPGGHGKAPLAGGYARPLGQGAWEIRDWRGGSHLYSDPALED